MDSADSTTATEICQPLWRYGLFAIDSEILVESNVKLDGQQLVIGKQLVALQEFDRILVVGAGKAGAGMAKGLLKALTRLATEKAVEGIVIVPDNCVESLDGNIALHGGRPASINEPTEKGQVAAQKMLELVRAAGPRDIAICLVSGGGSALAPLPVKEVSLDAKQKMTRYLSRHGASINELNCVRSAISQIKGGGLVKDFAGHSLHTLIISDVLGNPLEVIASGMTVPQTFDYSLAKQTLEKFDPHRTEIDPSIHQFIDNKTSEDKASEHQESSGLTELGSSASATTSTNVHNSIIGENKTAVSAIANMAQQLGYETEFETAAADEGPVEAVAESIWQKLCERIAKGGLIRPFIFVSGGEPTVTIHDQAGKGGRNQHLALIILHKLLAAEFPSQIEIEFVSLGTDGEDGPTDAAGAQLNQQVLSQVRNLNLDPADYLGRNDSYRFFEQVGGLIKTGPTHTNVCDIRILAIRDRSM